MITAKMDILTSLRTTRNVRSAVQVASLMMFALFMVGRGGAIGSQLPLSSFRGKDCAGLRSVDQIKLCYEINEGKIRLPVYPVKYTSSPRQGYMVLLGEQGASGRRTPDKDNTYVEIRSQDGAEITFAFGPVGPCLWCTVKETRSFSVPANRIRDWSWNYEDKPYKLRINYLSGEGEVKSVLISMEGDRNNEIDALLEDVTGKKSTPYVPQGQANVEEKCSKAADYKGCMEYHKSN